jgi:hypothetical protein
MLFKKGYRFGGIGRTHRSVPQNQAEKSYNKDFGGYTKRELWIKQDFVHKNRFVKHL